MDAPQLEQVTKYLAYDSGGRSSFSTRDTSENLDVTTLEILSVLDESKVLPAIAIRAAQLVDVKQCCLYLHDKEKRTVRVIAQSQDEPDFHGLEFFEGEGMTGTVLHTGEAGFVNNYWEWKGRTNQFDRNEFNTVLAIPLIHKKEIVGVLSVYHETRPFSERDYKRLQPFADLAAIAINNAKTYSAVSQTARELQRHEEQKTEQLIATRAELLKKNVQLQNLWKRLVQVQEDERTRIAHDLHDSTTQLIFGAIYATQAAIEQLQTEPVVASKSLETVVLLLNQIAGEIRDSISDLHPVILDKEGISTALRNYVQHISITTGIECVFESDGSPIRLPKTTELAIYRITQEALQNATLHANPTKICVKILYLGESIRLAVEDNGIGFIYPQDLAELEGCVTDSEISTYGVMGMRERAESIGALFEIITEPDVGTSVVLTIPL